GGWVGGWRRGDGPAAAVGVPAREEWPEDHQPQAVCAQGHEYAVERDDLPERGDVRAAQETEGEAGAAQEHETSGAEPIYERAHERRARPCDELGGGVGDGCLRAAPVKILEEGHEEHRVGMHEAGADGERGEGSAQEEAAPAAAWRGHGAHVTTWSSVAPPCTQARGMASRGQVSGA